MLKEENQERKERNNVGQKIKKKIKLRLKWKKLWSWKYRKCRTQSKCVSLHAWLIRVRKAHQNLQKQFLPKYII